MESKSKKTRMENTGEFQSRNEGVDKKGIEDRLNDVASHITTLEDWEKYISKYYPIFCDILAREEAKKEQGEAESDEKPIAVVLGGQPGAGKSALIATYKNILSNKYGINAVINNADFYRFCVPGSYRIATEYPESASRVTDPVVKRMRKNLIEEAIAQKTSIIIENTLGDTIVVDIMIQSGVHTVLLALMAVPREESLLSDFERYIKMKESADVARLVSIEAHDKRFIALDQIASRLENSGMRTLVHSRGETEHDFVNLEYDSQGETSTRYSNVIEAMQSIRQKTLKKGISTYPDRLKTIREKMEGFGMTNDEEQELQKLEGIIGKTISKEKEGEVK